MNECSPEAIAAYPPSKLIEDHDGDRYVDDDWGYDEAQRAAFDRGGESRRVADREALAEQLFHLARRNALSRIGLTEADSPHVNWGTTDRSAWLEDADAILASDAIRDEHEVKAEALEEVANTFEWKLSERDRSLLVARAAEIRLCRA